MEFIKNSDEFAKFEHLHSCDVIDEPEEFPCFVYLVVQSFGYEEERAVYLYKKDIEAMLAQIKEN